MTDRNTSTDLAPLLHRQRIRRTTETGADLLQHQIRSGSEVSIPRPFELDDLNRRRFLGVTAAGGVSALTLGCGAAAPHAIRGGAFLLKLIFTRAGKFDIALHASKFTLWGMFRLGQVPQRVFRAGNAILNLIDFGQEIVYAIEVASDGVGSTESNAVPSYEVDITEQIGSGAAISLYATGEGSALDYGGDASNFELAGDWTGYAPDGSAGQFEFVPEGGNSIAIYSPGFNGPARVSIFEQTEQTVNGERCSVSTGEVSGRFGSDQSGTIRTAPVKIIGRGQDVMDFETEYISWDEDGYETDRVFWPFRMERV